MKENKNISLVFHFLYLLLAAFFCYLYYIKVLANSDLTQTNSINAILTFQTVKPYQFRLLIPLLFMIFKPIGVIPDKITLFIYDIIIVYLILVVYSKLLAEYFTNKITALLLATVILYPMLFNYVILNQLFLFYDFTSILLFTLGLYFIIKDNFKWFIVSFIIALINKETAVYLIFSYLLYNYKTVFTKRIILNSVLLITIFVIYKLFLGYIFRNNPGDNVEGTIGWNIEIISNFYRNHTYFKNLAFNFGGLYIFIILLFLTGRRKKFTAKASAKLLYINLTFIPFYIMGIFVIYFTEVRVYSELIPIVTTLFLIYLSTFNIFSNGTAEKPVN